ncbi:MAG TPA: hypothetical protein PLJ34_00875 [Hyphomicrobiales bacterium]|nr:hypothetical protein [Kaistiaceae bacterium]HQF29975.1 hypothetical protein [Hyphomicrobiales bacterium]
MPNVAVRALAFLLFACFAAALPATSRADAGATALVEAWMAKASQSGAFTITYGRTNYDETRQAVVVEDFVATKTGEGATTTRVATLVLFGVEEDAAGEISAARAEAEGFVVDDAEAQITAAEAILEEVPLTVTDPTGEPAPFGIPHAVTLNDVVMRPKNGEPPLPIDSIHIDADAFEGDVPTHLTFAMEGMAVSVDTIEEEEQRRTLKELGYETLKMTIRGEGRTAPAAGEVTVDGLTIAAEGMGEVTLTAAFTGIPAEILRGEADPESEETGAKLIETAAVKALSLRFDNHAIVEKLIAQQAGKVGVGEDELVAQLIAMLPGALKPLQNPPFEAVVAEAIGTFLKSPGSLSVVAAPANPVPVSQLIGVAMMAPQTLIPVLSLDIRANRD